MNLRPTLIATQPQVALQSYLDGLLQDAFIELAAAPEALDEFAQAVQEELERDARLAVVLAPALAPAPELPEVHVAPPEPVSPPVSQVAVAVQPAAPAPVTGEVRPDWAQEPFECLLFDVAGLTLAVPLVSLGSIYPLAIDELTPLFGQPDWFLGLLPAKGGNLRVVDTARWVMPERYSDQVREGLRFVISVQGYEWGLAVTEVHRSIRLDPSAVKWRSQRTQRPWLAGTVVEHMCALLDVAAIAALISGAGKEQATPESADATHGA